MSDGLYDRDGMIDGLIVECSGLVKAAMGGEYVQFCALVVDMVQRLDALKEGTAGEVAGLKERIRNLEETLEMMTDTEAGRDVSH